jgi:hypothetical protein
MICDSGYDCFRSLDRPEGKILNEIFDQELMLENLITTIEC